MDIERKKKGKNFYYVKKNKIIDNPKILDRIKKLVIPPAWTNVLISNNSNDKVQCTGFDDKGRKQYKYNTHFIQEQTDIKYYDTLIKFGKHIKEIREDFPILSRKVHGKPLVYLDNAATAQTPKCVIDAVDEFYGQERANIHRGIHYLSDAATTRYETAREQVRKFINAPKLEEVLFVGGTTEGINLVAWSFGEAFVNADDEIIISMNQISQTYVSFFLKI